MRPTSQTFQDIITGSHTAKCRVRSVIDFPQSLSPTTTSTLFVVGGNVRFESSAQIRATLDVDIIDNWGDILPAGVELFVEYGVEIAGGSTEWVSLGYYRVDEMTQQNLNGPINVTCSDRMAQVIDTTAAYNYVVPAGTTHTDLFSSLLYGQSSPSWFTFFGVFPPTAIGQQIIFDYDAGVAVTNADIPLLDTEAKSYYDVLQRICDDNNKRMYFDYLGRLNVVDQGVEVEGVVARITGGPGGTLRNVSRQVTRRGVFNAVVATSSAPTEGQPLWDNTWLDNGGLTSYFSRFGRITRYISSPAYDIFKAVEQACNQELVKSKGLVYTLSLSAVVNPALEPLDTIRVDFPNGVDFAGTPPPPGMGTAITEVHVIDSLDIPLQGGDMSITTRAGVYI